MKDHFIPCLLLSRFSVDGSAGRKARVHQFNVDGPHPSRPVAAEDLAHAGDFYEHSDFPNLDEAGLHAKEIAAATLIRDLTNGADPEQHAEDVTSLLVLQGVRTRSFREGTAERVARLQDKAVDAFETPVGLDHVRRLLDEKLKHCDVGALVRLGIPREVAAFALARLGEAGLRKIIYEGVTPSAMSGVTEQIRTAISDGDTANVGIAGAQVKGLHALVSAETSEHVLSKARWIRIESTSEPFILGDSCVVCVGTEGTPGWLFKFGKDWREVYLPIGRHVAIVGLAPGGPSVPSMDATALNRASAGLARDYIYASRCTPVEKDLAAQIGSIEPLMTDAGLDEVIDDAMRKARPAGESESG